MPLHEPEDHLRHPGEPEDDSCPHGDRRTSKVRTTAAALCMPIFSLLIGTSVPSDERVPCRHSTFHLASLSMEEREDDLPASSRGT